MIASALLTLLLVALLHLLVIHWGKAYINHSAADAPNPSSLSVTLAPLLPPQQPVALPRPRPQTPPPPPAKALAVPAAATLDAAPWPSFSPAVAALPELQHATPAVSEPPQETRLSTSAQASRAEDNHYRIDVPPSAALEYEVHARADNLDWHGTSTLTWTVNDDHYTLVGEVYARFFAKITFLTFVSNGEINEFGVAPERYTEKKRNRSATNTHFNRERNVVSFSASTTSYPRIGGEQDRASLIWQLAAIGRGDSEQFVAGKLIDMFVAGTRDGEIWRMQVDAQENIHLPFGLTQAWHLVRQPRSGSYEQRLDIWLAPTQQWYPVRLRFTETNGDYLEMTLSNLKNPIN